MIIFELKEFMKLNVKAEEEAILGYMTILKYTNNIYLRKVYERILIDERTHLEIFRKVLADLN